VGDPDMTEKIGRKALFMGVASKKDDPIQGEPEYASYYRQLCVHLDAIKKGEAYAPLEKEKFPEPLRPLISSLEELITSIEEDRKILHRLQDAFEQNPAPIILKDDSNHKIIASHSYDSLVESIVSSETSAINQISLNEMTLVTPVLGDKKPGTLETNIDLNDGRRLVMEQTATPVFDENDTIKGVFFTLQDLTPLKNLEKDVHDAALAANSLVSSSDHMIRMNPVPILLLDDTMKILQVNEAFNRMSGLAESDLPGREYGTLGLLEKKGQSVEEILRFKKFGVSETVFEFPSGVHILMQYGIPVPVRDSPDKYRIMLLFFDITSMKEEEDRLKEQLVFLSEEVEELKNISHPTAVPQSVQPPVSQPTLVIEQKPEPMVKAQPKVEKTAPAKIITHDVVEFEIGHEKYALDINLAREIVEMMPITPIPRSPQYLCGIMNLRGEITNIININTILGVPDVDTRTGKKIIVLSSDATGGENIGIIVDDVQSVISVQDQEVEQLGGGISSLSSAHIKGIIKTAESKTIEKKGEKAPKNLIIWIDMLRLLQDLVQLKKT
jgi:purine-binding chemotaxis protein CheW